MSAETPSLKVTFGPLRYEFIAHDAWGKDALCRLCDNVVCISFTGAADRIIHLLRFELQDDEHREAHAGRIPPRLAAHAPKRLQPEGWAIAGDDAGQTAWQRQGEAHSFWTYATETPHFAAAFQLPWRFIFGDIVALGGGIIHSGIAVRGERGHLFIAPPGGGKTTALTSAPTGWKVLSDDGTLLWPDEAGEFLVSPLPTWSVLRGDKRQGPPDEKWDIAAACPLWAAILLEKQDHDTLTPLAPAEAIRPLYRALSEYPAIIASRHHFRQHLFHLAAEISRKAHLWRLGFARTGSFWSLL